MSLLSIYLSTTKTIFIHNHIFLHSMPSSTWLADENVNNVLLTYTGENQYYQPNNIADDCKPIPLCHIC